jgi:catechol 2,3-dioxygenase-like lactoylglutathione lyase family enzyme
VFGAGAGFGGVDGQGEPGFGNHVEAFVGDGEVAEHLVVEVLGARAVQPDVVRAPAAAEFFAAGGQFANEVMQPFVVGVAAGFGAQDGDGGVGGEVPVKVEAVGIAFEEGVAGEVRRAGGSLSWSEECIARPR